jgi:L,D-transpeptidase YcbB
MKIFLVICCCICVAMFALVSCDGAGSGRPMPPKEQIVKEPAKLETAVIEQMSAILDLALLEKGQANGIEFYSAPQIASIYNRNGYTRIWGKDKQWYPAADSFFLMIGNAEHYGLFPSDYHWKSLEGIFRKLQDSVSMNDAALWARGEILLSDAFASFARHLSKGRLPRDSVSLNPDSLLTQDFYDDIVSRMKAGEQPRVILEAMEPIHPGYQALRAELPAFLQGLDRTRYTYVEFPAEDSLAFVKQLQTRLYEGKYIAFNTRMPDSLELSNAVRAAQQQRGLKVDGKAGPVLVASLNNTGPEKFKRIAINMDRYKQLADSMPKSFIWVNLPSYKMQVWDSGLVVLESKVIVGQPKTRTPVLNGQVSNFVTYPQWTVPYSIIFKEMLPKIRKDLRYLAKENLMVVDRNDSVIDPALIDWSKLSKTNFPYQFKQRQGDDNSLGVMKFNFRNKYDVYLHDTNARSLFSRPSRALSHGCVRVQEWDSLARYLIARDTTNTPIDSVTTWLARQEKHTVGLRQKVPVYLRYFTCEVPEEGGIRFFEDIYGEDKMLRMRHFSRK